MKAISRTNLKESLKELNVKGYSFNIGDMQKLAVYYELTKTAIFGAQNNSDKFPLALEDKLENKCIIQ